jgi:hypothetical protein
LYSEEFTITTTPGTYFPITPTVTNTSCSGSTGAIALNVGTAQTPTYLWSNGATTQNLTALASGQYSVSVTDATGCVQTQKYEVFEDGGLIEVNLPNYQINGGDMVISNGKLFFSQYLTPLGKIGILDISTNSTTIFSTLDFIIPTRPLILKIGCCR